MLVAAKQLGLAMSHAMVAGKKEYSGKVCEALVFEYYRFYHGLV